MKNIKDIDSKTDIDIVKKDIQRLVNEKSKCYRLDFSKKEDIALFFGDGDFLE